MIICHIASLPERESCLQKTIMSLQNQVDRFYIELNNYVDIPTWLQGIRNVECLDNSLGDGAKFLHFDEDGYHFFCDDDLIYSPTHCEYLLTKYRQLGGVITLHGKVYGRPIVSPHRGIIENYRCLGTVVGDYIVDTGGTGAMLINSKDIRIDISEFRRPNMADIWLAKIAHDQNVPIRAVEHKIGIVRYMPQDKTIWRSHTKEDDVYQTKILNSFLK